jgi:hypothetical protein
MSICVVRVEVGCLSQTDDGLVEHANAVQSQAESAMGYLVVGDTGYDLPVASNSRHPFLVLLVRHSSLHVFCFFVLRTSLSQPPLANLCDLVVDTDVLCAYFCGISIRNVPLPTA